MKKLYLPFLVLLAVAACSKEKIDETPDEKPDPVKSEAPKVVSTTPAANATDVELLEEVVKIFVQSLHKVGVDNHSLVVNKIKLSYSLLVFIFENKREWLQD